ncbi:energy transducer TonB [Aquicella siphonis]|nr:energy transducer TonB [Aquicella siphonis]
MKTDPKPSLNVPPSLPSYVYREASVPRSNVLRENNLPARANHTGTLAVLSRQSAGRPTEAANRITPSLPAVRKINQFNVVNLAKKSEPVHLIGDKNVDVPLLALIGKALTSRLAYPKIAIDFNVRGLVLIGFTIHPDGHITDAQLVKTSGAGVLDDEALRALRSIALVPEVNAYLHEPRFMVVGILFGTHA